MNAFIEKLDNAFFRSYYPLIFAIPLNIILMGDNAGIGIQWPFFRFDFSPAGIGFFPITNSFLFPSPEKSLTGQYVLFFGVVFLVLSYILLYYRITKTAGEAGLLTLLGAFLILWSSMTDYGVFFSGPAGISVPVGVLLILVLGILMYRHPVQEPETRPLKNRKIRTGVTERPGRKPQDTSDIRADPSGIPGIPADYYFSLVFLNFVTNYIFLSFYGFVSDDWSTMSPVNAYTGISFSQLLFEPQRPFTYIIIKTLPFLFGNNQVLFFLLSFILTSGLLLVIFFVTHTLLNQIAKTPPSYAFLIAVLYCLLFNKGELYAFGGTMPNTIASILYFASFYFFICSEKRPSYIFYSLVCFTLALFTYELGIFFPVMYFLYARSFNKPVKNVWMFVAPILFFIIIRFTNWFGHGLALSKASVIPVSGLTSFSSMGNIPFYFSTNLRILLEFAAGGISCGILGLKSLPFSTIVLLFLLNIAVAVLIVWVLVRTLPSVETDIPRSGKKSLIVLGCAGMLFPFVLITLHGLMASRYMGFIDFFTCFIVVLAAMNHVKKTVPVIISLTLIIVFCLTINQGLYFNYVVSHNIQNAVDKAIAGNAENIIQYKTVFFNVDDLRIVRGTYGNAVGIQSWSLRSMMQNAGIDTSQIKLVYNTEGEEPESLQNLSANESFFEFNRTNINLNTIYQIQNPL